MLLFRRFSFSRLQQEGETLQEFLLALMGLMEAVKLQAPTVMQKAELLLCDQFVGLHKVK